MDELKLNEDDFNFIAQIIDLWKSSYDSFMALPFNERFEDVVRIAKEHLLKRWPGLKSTILEYKDENNKDNLKDNIAFFIGNDKPELYIYLTLSGPLLLDSYKYDAYDKGPFLKPDWDKI